MKINLDKIDKVAGEIKQNEVNKNKQENGPGVSPLSEDKVELSSEALDLNQMQSKIKSQPDIRSDKVDRIQLQVNNSEYKISTEKVAEKLLDEII